MDSLHDLRVVNASVQIQVCRLGQLMFTEDGIDCLNVMRRKISKLHPKTKQSENVLVVGARGHPGS